MNKTFLKGLRVLGLSEDFQDPLVVTDTRWVNKNLRNTEETHLLFPTGERVLLYSSVINPPYESNDREDNYRLPTEEETLTIAKALYALCDVPGNNTPEDYPTFTVEVNPGYSCSYCGCSDYNEDCPECRTTVGGRPDIYSVKIDIPGRSRYITATTLVCRFENSGITIQDLLYGVDELGYEYAFKPAKPCSSCGAIGHPNDQCQACWGDLGPAPAAFIIKKRS